MTVRDKVNDAARRIAKAEGWQFDADLDFCESNHPRAQYFWAVACIAYEAFFGDAPDFDAEIDAEAADGATATSK